MANIPVEKKSGFPWWLALLGLLLVAGLIWLFMELAPGAEEDVDVAGMDGVEAVEGDVDAEVAVGPLVMTGMVYDGADRTLIGREVEMGDLKVVNVLGDATFTVASSMDAEDTALVYLDQEMTPGIEGIEGRYDVNAGQTVTIYGSIAELTAENVANWDLEAPGANTFTAGDLYVIAQRLDISDAELETVEVDGDE